MNTKQKMAQQERFDFILQWLVKEFAADACNQAFHESYHNKFPSFAQKRYVFGAEPVAQAQRDLRAMAGQGLLEVRRVGLGQNWRPGFPKHVLSYCLPSSMREIYAKRFDTSRRSE